MSRAYGILFSEYSNEKYSLENKLICLEDLRQALEKMFPNSDYEFDIIKVISHSSDNLYPEIGIHCSSELSDADYKKMEQFVIKETSGKNPNVLAAGLQKSTQLNWEFVKNKGSFPSRT